MARATLRHVAHEPRARARRRGWQAQPIDEARASALAAEIGVRRLTAAILLGRGLGDSARAARFLAPRLADLRRPEGMADLERTLDRLARRWRAGSGSRSSATTTSTA